MSCTVTCNATLLNLAPAAGIRLDFISAAQQYLVEGPALVLPDSSAFVVLSSAGTGTITLSPGLYQVLPSSMTTGEGYPPFYVTVPALASAYLHVIRNLPPPATLDAAQQAVLDAQTAANGATSSAATATTKAGEASVSAAAAAASAGSAAGSAATATTQAGIATQAAIDASVSADAAAASAAMANIPVFTTRAEFVDDHGVFAAGTIVQVGPIQFIKDGGTRIGDLPGWSPNGVWTPLHWGCAGNSTGTGGGTDDGVALNACLTAYRAATEAIANGLGSFDLDGLGLIYRSTISVNMTGITGWGWAIRHLSIYSEATGKTALDTTGSRGSHLSQIMVYGSKTNQPRVGIMTTRAASPQSEAFADEQVWDQVRTRGYFSLTALYDYGAESVNMQGCQFWNSQFDAHTAIISGRDIYPAQSDYLTPITGATSHINCGYDVCEFRYLPEAVAVTGLTIGNPLVIGVGAGATWLVGQKIVLQGTNSQPAGGSIVATISAVGAGTITVNINATGWPAWTSGGTVYRAQTKSSLLLSRINGHSFNDPYIVCYGDAAVEFAFDAAAINGVHFNNTCIEAYGIQNYFKVTTNGGATAQFVDFKYSGYAGRAQSAYITHDATGGNLVQFQNAEISLATVSEGSAKLFHDETKYTLYNVDLSLPSPSMIVPASFPAFKGKLHTISDGAVLEYGGFMQTDGDIVVPSGAWPSGAWVVERVVGTNGTLTVLQRGTGGMQFTVVEAGAINFATTNVQRWSITAAGQLLPFTDLAVNLGDPTKRIAAGFFGALEIDAGTAANPSLRVAADPNTGLFSPGADILAVSAGGTERLRVTTAGAQVTGLISGTAVTQTQTDTTPGRLVKPGDFGLGLSASLNAPIIANLDDNTLASGIYRTGDAITISGTWPPSNPTGFNRAGQLMVMRHDGGSLNQMWYSLGEQGVWFRRYTGAAWGAWHRATPMLGTVSQASGVPTGAIVERGSNANGEFVRFADGTMICTRTGFALGAVNVADGALFKSAADATLTLPSTFIASPIVHCGAASDADVWVTPVSETTSTITLRARCATSKASGTTGEMTAIGRWF